MKTVWGIDLGGTKTEGVVLDLQHNVLARKRIPTESHKGYEHILDRIHELINQLAQETGMHPEELGIGTPGMLDPSTLLMKNSNTTCLNGMPLLADLQEKTGLVVRMENDANCFALAETHMGAVAKYYPDAKVVFGIIMGTGVGGGIIIDGKPLPGKHGIAGEWGHNFLDTSGGLSYTGKKGVVETILSGPSLENFYFEQAGKHKALPEIVTAYQTGDDEHAAKTMLRLVHFFGKAIAVVINILDPDVIVIGGGVGNIHLLYDEGVKEVKNHVFNDRLDTPFVRPQLGDSAGVFGAAMLVNP